MKQTQFLRTLRLLTALVLLTGKTVAAPVGTAFTYQGRLNDSGNAATGIYDLRFTIYDALAGGNAVGSSQTNAATLVTNGLFTVKLDFGPGVFAGDARWLELAARTNGSPDAFEVMAPRNELTPSPYAQFAGGAATALVANSANSVAGMNIQGQVPLSKLPLQVLTNGEAGVILSGNFSGDGSGVTNLAAANLRGNIPDSLLSRNIARLYVQGTATNATATPVVTSGFITSAVILSGGSGYTANPNVTISDVTGGGAVVTANAFNGVVVTLTVLNAGHGYSTNATLTIDPPPSNASQTFLSTNYFAGVNLMTNPANVFVGTFSGDGTSLANVNAASFGGQSAANFWQLGGNNVSPGQFIGSVNNQPVEIWANNQRAVRIEPNSATAPNVIAGAPVNYVANGVMGATIGGGGALNYAGIKSNSVTADFGTVSGGSKNTVGGMLGSIGGGFNNNAIGQMSAISGGMNNDSEGFGGVVSGGLNNTNGSGGDYASIGGGNNNNASGQYATLAGGLNNNASGMYATVGGGSNNKASNQMTTVSGGGNNSAGTYGATVAGGLVNTASGLDSTVSGGNNNTASGSYATVAGGFLSQAANSYATVPGGSYNLAGGQNSFAAGRMAKATHDGSFVWADSLASMNFNSVTNNEFAVRANGGVRLVTGGTGLKVDGQLAILNGSGLTIQQNAGGSPNLIGGYTGNSVDNGVIGAVIGGGGMLLNSNRVSANFGVVSGGAGNTAAGSDATVSGGANNAADSEYATIGGGAGNSASGHASTISGGQENWVDADSGTIGGGFDNAAGFCATVPGGYQNHASGSYSFAAGQEALATHDGTFVWADSQYAVFESSAINQFLIRAAGGVGINTNDPAGAALRVNGNQRTDGNASIGGNLSTGGSVMIQQYPGNLMIGGTDESWSVIKAEHGTLTLNKGGWDQVLIPSGHVGISVTDATSVLDVGDRMRLREGASGTAGLWLYQKGPASDQAFIGMDGDGYVGLYGDSGAGWGLVMNVTNGDVVIPSGRVGIGTSAPQFPMDVNGSIHVNGDVLADGSFWCKFGGFLENTDWHRLLFGGSYGGHDDAYNAYWNSSDQRLKRDVTTIPNALGLVSQLRGVNYHWNEVGLQFLTRDIEKDWKSDSGKPEDNQALWQKKRAEACEKLSKTQTGFIAQEVERVFPDWVKTDEQGFKKINMEHLNAVLVNAINEQQTEIENQQTQIQTLKTQQTELEKNLSAKDAELQALHAKVAEVDQWKQRLEAIEKLLAPAK